MQGKSGISPIEKFDTHGYSTQFAGEIKELDVSKYVNKKMARRLDDVIKYTIVAGKKVRSLGCICVSLTMQSQSCYWSNIMCYEGSDGVDLRLLKLLSDCLYSCNLASFKNEGRSAVYGARSDACGLSIILRTHCSCARDCTSASF